MGVKARYGPHIHRRPSLRMSILFNHWALLNRTGFVGMLPRKVAPHKLALSQNTFSSPGYKYHWFLSLHVHGFDPYLRLPISSLPASWRWKYVFCFCKRVSQTHNITYNHLQALKGCKSKMDFNYLFLDCLNALENVLWAGHARQTVLMFVLSKYLTDLNQRGNISLWLRSQFILTSALPRWTEMPSILSLQTHRFDSCLRFPFFVYQLASYWPFLLVF